jgi:hypothetical protein
MKTRGAKIVRTPPAGGADLIFHGASRRDMLDRISELKRWLKPKGALWVIRPKGSKAITESQVMAAGKEAGLVDAKVVSFSETLTAEKFIIRLRDR